MATCDSSPWEGVKLLFLFFFFNACGGECSFTAVQVSGIFTYHFHIFEHRRYSLQTSFRQITATWQGRKTVKDHQSALLSSQVSAGEVTPTGALGLTIPTLTCSLTCSCHQLETTNQVQTSIVPSWFCQFCPINPKFGAHLQSNRESDFITILNVPSPCSLWSVCAKGCEDRKDLLFFVCTLPAEELCVVLDVVFECLWVCHLQNRKSISPSDRRVFTRAAFGATIGTSGQKCVRYRTHQGARRAQCNPY